VGFNVNTRRVTRDDLIWLRPTSEVRSCHRYSHVKGPHFWLLTSQRVSNCFYYNSFLLMLQNLLENHQIPIFKKKWSALITDMFVMIAFSIWELRYNDDTTLSCQHDLMVFVVPPNIKLNKWDSYSSWQRSCHMYNIYLFY
jgi:hypothetical protein